MNSTRARCCLVAALLPVLACSVPRELPVADDVPALVRDHHSFAEPTRVRVTHVALDLQLDFERRVVAGTATLTVARRDPTAPLVLDTDALAVLAVRGADGSERPFTLGDEDEVLGTPLVITLAPGDQRVTVQYETTAGSEALQWLTPEQTAGGRHPFLYTQGQSILTRSWIPLQDSPGVRVTYEARIRAPDELTVVMSAEHRGREDGAWRFELDKPIPSYLIALACGDLVSKAISERCAVWADPVLVDAAHFEFADTETMMQTIESMFGEYRWGRYDILILPPAFPFGGMENPLLTFLTPTVIAGDRSLVAINAHELAHSWSGNLVTNATWRDFWLNEGFTTYLEKRIMAAVYGEERARMERLLDYQGLVAEIEDLEPWQEVLHVDLEGRHPDDAFCSIPYEKGALFLRRIDELMGREAFDAMLTQWFDDHAFESVTTHDFLAFLETRLARTGPAALAALDVGTWVFEPGLPDTAPVPASQAFERVEAEVARYAAGTSPEELDVDGWITQQWLHFLGSLPGDLSAAQMAGLDEAFQFRNTGNNEILFAWLQLGIRHGYAANDDILEAFLMTVGRRKFLAPLYTELVESEGGRERALALYRRARPRYHAVSTNTIDEIVGWPPTE